MRFWKGQALGNDYIVLDAAEADATEVGLFRAICDRHRGVGSDGVLLGDTTADPIALRIFNPDGSEAEKSGNGLRIFGAWLHRQGLVSGDPFRVALPGETVEMTLEAVDDAGVRTLRVAMGRASFRAGDVGFTGAGADDEVLGLPVQVGGESAAIHTVSMGNPHCVVLEDRLDRGRFLRLAPGLRAHRLFRNGTNVQFASPAGPGELDAMVWERGVGETQASGSSACAVVAAARRVGRIAGDRFVVRMPGGAVAIRIDDDWNLTLTGPAEVVYEGSVSELTLRKWRDA